MNDSCELPSPSEQDRLQQRPPSIADAPMPAAAEHSYTHNRRTFLFQLAVGMNAIVGAVLAVPLLGYVLSPVFRRDGAYNSWVRLARVDTMPVGATRLLEFLNPTRTPTDGETAKIPVWARRTAADQYEVFAINCAHLGCPVRWFEQSQLFLCPCHGGAYYASGEVAAGPPPRGLYKYDVRIENGSVLIHAGELPTLKTVACAGEKHRDLVQIGSSAAAPGHNLVAGPGEGSSDKGSEA